MDRLSQAFSQSEEILNIYFTAGYPELHSTVDIADQLHKNGVNLMEIGLPFSDPLADGPTIQKSSQIAIKNGMTIDILFKQIEEIRIKNPTLAIVLMGYLNPLLQYGVDAFLKRCQQVGVDALIIPDLPLQEYQTKYKGLFNQYQIKICFLITPQTSTQRILELSEACTGFLYVVSTYSITGGQAHFGDDSLAYFKKVDALNLPIPKLIGFGIRSKKDLKTVYQYAQGGIIGSAFIQALDQRKPLSTSIKHFITPLL